MRRSSVSSHPVMTHPAQRASSRMDSATASATATAGGIMPSPFMTSTPGAPDPS